MYSHFYDEDAEARGLGLASGGVGSEAVFCLADPAAHPHTFDQEAGLRAASEMTF